MATERINVCGVIPARMASRRLPGKPLAKILGMPMVGHVYCRSRLSHSLDDLWVATCDGEIYNYIISIGGQAVMTAASHERAAERTAEALMRIEEFTEKKIDFVALIQGDEPMLVPAMIDDLVSPVKCGENVEIVNLICKIESGEEFEDSNIVKVVADREGYALYFSREPIPSRKKYVGQVPMWRQLGIILFSRDALRAYSEMEQTPLEVVESVDMNRFLEYGRRIRLVETIHRTHPVETKPDLVLVEVLMGQDPLVEKYLYVTG